MFVTGDLNFRTRLPDVEPGSSEHVEVTHQLAYANDYETLNEFDEIVIVNCVKNVTDAQEVHYNRVKRAVSKLSNPLLPYIFSRFELSSAPSSVHPQYAQGREERS
jgi:hypothetical protein